VSGVSPSGNIPANFNWLCLADILECFENDQLVDAACHCKKAAISPEKQTTKPFSS
jgi:hypothetical protein